MKKENILKNKNITLTGSTGYIGSKLLEKLKKYSCRIIIINKKKKLKLKNVEYINLDINKKSSWKKIILLSDYVVHLSWNNSVKYAEKYPKKSFDEASIPIISMIKAAKETKKKVKFIFTSTVTLYGITGNKKIDESYKPNPITQYDLNKILIEKEISLASEKKIIVGISLRLANVYGPSKSKSLSKERGVLNGLVKNAINKKIINIYGDGLYYRNFVYIDDVIDAIIYSLKIKKFDNNIYNISDNQSYRLNKFFEIVKQKIFTINNLNIKLKNVSWPTTAREIDKRSFKCSNELFKKATGWSPKISLKEGITKLITSYNR